MITEIIEALNIKFKKLFEKYPDAKIYGLTQPVIRISGTVHELLPSTVDNTGEITYVGIDDIAPIILYHKNNSVSSVQTLRNGIGDASGDVMDTFNNSIIIYIDRKRVKTMPDELVFYIQSNMPDAARMEPFKNIRILFQGVILNSAQIYTQEYGAEGLDPGKSMLAVNYQIEVTFKKDCFSNCLTC